MIGGASRFPSVGLDSLKPVTWLFACGSCRAVRYLNFSCVSLDPCRVRYLTRIRKVLLLSSLL
jgi:hypothetical protein